MSENKTVHVQVILKGNLATKYDEIKAHLEKKLGINFTDSDILRAIISAFHRDNIKGDA